MSIAPQNPRFPSRSRAPLTPAHRRSGLLFACHTSTASGALGRVSSQATVLSPTGVERELMENAEAVVEAAKSMGSLLSSGVLELVEFELKGAIRCTVEYRGQEPAIANLSPVTPRMG